MADWLKPKMQLQKQRSKLSKREIEHLQFRKHHLRQFRGLKKFQSQSMIHRRNQLHLQGVLTLQSKNGRLKSSFQPESMVLIQNQTPFVMNDGQWTQQEHEAHLHKAAHATLVHVWNREAREEAERQNREFVRNMADWKDRVEGAGFKAHPSAPHFPPPKSVASMRVLPDVHDALRQRDPSKAPASQPSVPKKAPPTTAKGIPAGFYRVEEPPRIGSGQVQPAPPPKLPGSTPTTPAHPPRPPIEAIPKLAQEVASESS